MAPTEPGRHMGVLGATGVGVGAIVGGGILALTGTAFSVAGPSAILAFALNAAIALLTALSFAEVSSKFPQSGGTYTFAKKVLSIEAAFTVGWVVWFASIVAAVLYALGFGQFAAVAAADIWNAVAGPPPGWLASPLMVRGLAIGAALFYTINLIRTSEGGGQWANVGKLLVFSILILCGLWALRHRTVSEVEQTVRPFFPGGAAGLFQAMGFTFIALQGFDLIAAVAGEIRAPERTIPRAMLGSLGIAIVIYLPLLFVIMTVGVPVGQSVTDVSRENPNTLVAVAAQNYLGRFGYWLVIGAAILSMVSALHANLFAASRVAFAMSFDRTLPKRLSTVGKRSNTPAAAITATAAIVMAVAVLLPDLSAAGAASSLIFLITFALVHWIAILVRQRTRLRPPPFLVPMFPVVPVLGGLACLALATYQGIAVRSAGVVTLVWLAIGALLFLLLFARRARISDASLTATDLELSRLRGRDPLVLVPVANPDNAHGLVTIASALAPPEIGRVLLMSVVVAEDDWRPSADRGPLQKAQEVLAEAIAASVEAGLVPESLTTVAKSQWEEIARVARLHRCQSLLLGLTHLTEESVGTPLDDLMGRVDCDVVVLRAPKGWRLNRTPRILIPTGGRGEHDQLLARLLSSISRQIQPKVALLNVLPPGTPEAEQHRTRRALRRTANDLNLHECDLQVVASDSAVDEVVDQAQRADLAILGMQRVSRREKLFGQFALQVAQRTTCPMLLISRGR
mgnify:CR=1 FL=1